MLVLSRFRYDEEQVQRAQLELGTCLDRFAACPGYVRGSVGRSTDEPGLWVLQTQWANVGAYRRAVSSYEIKLHVVPLLYQAIDEPSAFEVIIGEGATTPNESRPREL